MNELIYGKNVVLNAIKADREIYNLYVTKENKEIISLAKSKGLEYEVVDKAFIDKRTTGLHQGVLALVSAYSYSTLDEVIASSKHKLPFLVILDGLQDPHNFGAIIRTAEAAGVDGIIIPKHRSVKVNATVAKVSTGAIEYVKVVEVVNLNQTIKTLKQKGYWIVGAEYSADSISYDKIKYDMPIALVIGSEGFGVSRLVKENCDFLVKIPMKGKINSLNASVSAGILIYEVLKYRQ